MSIDREWLIATLTDSLECLQNCIDRLEDSRHSPEDVLLEDVANVYAKLNYAVNTAELGPNAIDEVDHNVLIAWPETMPFDRDE